MVHLLGATAEDSAVSAAVFGAIHGIVGKTKQFFRTLRSIRYRSNADTQRYDTERLLCCIRERVPCDRLSNSFCEHAGIFLIRFGSDNNEFLAAPSGQGIRLSNSLRHCAGLFLVCERPLLAESSHWRDRLLGDRC